MSIDIITAEEQALARAYGDGLHDGGRITREVLRACAPTADDADRWVNSMPEDLHERWMTDARFSAWVKHAAALIARGGA